MADPFTELFCPRCRLPLKQVRTSHGMLWACDKCGGRAVGLELLRRTFTAESINPLWLHAIGGEGRSGCRCPSCGNPMLEVRLSDKALVKVDVCRLCHFVWFDAHEVDTLVPRPLPAAQPKLPQKARDAIAMMKVEQLQKRHAELILIVIRRMTGGSKSRPFVGCRLNSTQQRQRENLGSRGRFV